jgi:hypothetical protein
LEFIENARAPAADILIVWQAILPLPFFVVGKSGDIKLFRDGVERAVLYSNNHYVYSDPSELK